MAVHCSMELEDIHWWLPHKILEDIDIANPEELRIMAVVEELATHLSAVLGSTNIRVQCHTLPPKSLDDSYMPQCPAQLQLIGLQSWGHVTSYGNLPSSRAAQQPLLSTGSLPRVAPARPPLVGVVLPLTMRRGIGTGVFFPRTREPNHHTSRGTKPLRNDRAESYHGKQLCQRKQCQHGEEGKARRQLGHHAHAMSASEMKNMSTAPFCGQDNLSLPQGWIY
ncbi:unnamed protein product [Urochloa decumbens]|uniref:Uncharacterized protein n=1 Tax=Urochloa decumbens TaxID=240449 RepID=A0ABC9GIB3_9POAL